MSLNSWTCYVTQEELNNLGDFSRSHVPSSESQSADSLDRANAEMTGSRNCTRLQKQYGAPLQIFR